MALSNDDQKKMLEIYEKAKNDPSFKNELLNNTQNTLKPYHISFLENMEVKVCENTKNEFHIVVPVNPLPSNVKVQNLPSNPALAQVTAWIVTQIQEETPFKEKLLKNPEAVLKEQRITIPEELKVIIHTNSEKLKYFILPRSLDTDEELSATELELVAGGKSTGKGDSGTESTTTNLNIDDNAINTGTNYGIVDSSPVDGVDIEGS